MLRMMDPEELSKYDDMTPTCLDYLGSYRDGVAELPFFLDRAPNDPTLTPGNAANLGKRVVPWFGDWGNAQTNKLDDGGNFGRAPTTFLSYPNNVLAFDMNRPAGAVSTHKPRGNFKILGIWANTGAGAGEPQTRVPTIEDTEVYVQFQVTEPLLLSPFIFGSGEGKQGFYGIQTMNFQMNMLSNASRAWRCCRFGADFTRNVVVERFEDSTLHFQFLTPHASEMLEARNVVPYYEFPVYRTTNFSDIPGRGAGTVGTNGLFSEGGTAVLNSSNIQLNGIPDKLIIFVRKNMGVLDCRESDKYLTIKGIRINFNNQAGLLASQSPQQLYRNSVLSGLHMSWEQFSGLTTTVAGRAAGTAEAFGAYTGLGANFTSTYNQTTDPPTIVPSTFSPGFKYIPTTGSVLTLNFGEVIQLTDEYYSAGSLGTFNLQISLDVVNNHGETWPANSYEMIIIPMNSGVFVNERGTSSTFLSLLTKQDVLDSLSQTPYTNFEIHRLVGGASFMDRVRSGMHWLHSKMPAVKQVLGNIPHPMAQTAHNVMGALGYGMSGGGMSGGGRRSIEDRVKS
jgi:hypothetical protein